MRFKKMVSMLLAASMCAGALSGCAGSSKGGSETTAQQETAGESSAEGGNSGDISGNITFSWWGGDSRHEATEKAIEAFQAKYEGVTVSPEYGAWSGWEEKQSLNILGGNSADLMQINWNWIDLYSNNGTNFADLNQYADIIDLSQFPESALEIRLPQSHWL